MGEQETKENPTILDRDFVLFTSKGPPELAEHECREQ